MTQFQRIFELWAASENRVRLMVFYRHNPDVVDSLEGLARRLAIPRRLLDGEVAACIAGGILREREVAGARVLVFDPSRWAEVETLLREEAGRRGEEADRAVPPAQAPPWAPPGREGEA